mmetsp:Transcript_16802/g.26153  ORF Transcript_16802/g.26153 Transcript_16802/m.26153 type:complete len:83 (+) Transcript_16802:321-569(+)
MSEPLGHVVKVTSMTTTLGKKGAEWKGEEEEKEKEKKPDTRQRFHRQARDTDCTKFAYSHTLGSSRSVRCSQRPFHKDHNQA